jgi:hypothetical protein
MTTTVKYPTLAEVDAADPASIELWYYNLPPPTTGLERVVSDRIAMIRKGEYVP